MSKKNKLIVISVLAIIGVIVAGILFAQYATKLSRLSKSKTYELCFVYKNQSQTVFGTEEQSFTVFSSSERALYHSILEALMSDPYNDQLKTIFPASLEIKDITLNNSTLSINFSSEFNSMEDYDKALAKYCITDTFLKFDNIAKIRISVEGTAVNDSDPELDLESFITGPSQLRPTTTEIYIYTLSEDGTYLISTPQSFTWYGHQSFPEIVAEKMMQENLGKAIPSGTRTHSIYSRDNTVFVEFSPEFGSYTGEKGKLAVYSVVNTMATIPGISYVQISLNGELSSISDIPMDSPLIPNLTYADKNH
ncbi:MAG: GerMN domain-containing protein [Clostridia bacterium]|nr:GerMN domain-containing protein [Clostridia bacterium]